VAADYSFRTSFELSAPPTEVHTAALSPERWLSRMPHVRELVQLADGGAEGDGARYRTTVAAAAPYRLRWEMEAVRVVTPERIEWLAEGDLSGRGIWELTPSVTGTEVVSSAILRTTRWWMNLLEPLARPLFVRNHDLVMRAGVDALATHLDAEVTRYERGDLVTTRR
jgi:hypothetical protein